MQQRIFINSGMKVSFLFPCRWEMIFHSVRNKQTKYFIMSDLILALNLL